MSRIGKRPIPVPDNVEVKIEGDLLSVKGPKGELKRRIHPKISVSREENSILLHAADESRDARSLHGLFGALVYNMVTGVTRGFEKALEIVGVGYRAELKGRTAVFNLGYSHPIDFQLPDGIDARIEKSKVVLSGIDKELVGLTAARIRGLRPPEPYKGKGIKYSDETIRKKAGKAGAAK
ncbi:MAG: 50S ribosomal protein L6 [Deltaproteobacteria bacterium]|nr:50S ribosomal protein L6 [Deltaproteobacteria bacterium]MBW2048079.1 50S ribosomal protein L6 [Deltaproteobacteria bacterium]MBW2110463.1 50S ribosomal protein L6 [Deltaproteobacteria bacterium]MBW2352626.1 50S ribosomal protein L6 [Deltaproteobacteria bacterium]HDZ90826.1 50S ribosomal protein L6 [Deltaproteobacteria bacterium]